MAQYRYVRFKPDSSPKPQLVAPEGLDALRVERIAEAIAFGRDLVNTPANVLGPEAFEAMARSTAPRGDAELGVGQQVFLRKYASDFALEMNRSVREALKAWIAG